MELTEEPEPEEPDYDDDSSDDFMEEDGGRTSAAKENLQNILFGAGRAFQNLKKEQEEKEDKDRERKQSGTVSVVNRLADRWSCPFDCLYRADDKLYWSKQIIQI